MSQQWCAVHWDRVRLGVMAGTHNGIVATLALMQRWINKMTQEHKLAAHMSNTEKNALLAMHAPLCCTMGPAVLDEVMQEALNREPTPLCLKCLVPRDVCSCPTLRPDDLLSLAPKLRADSGGH